MHRLVLGEVHQALHVDMAVDDTGGRGEQPRFRSQGRLIFSYTTSRQPLQVAYAIGFGSGFDSLQWFLITARANNIFSQRFTGDIKLAAVLVEKLLAPDTEAGLKAVLGIVNTGMNDFAVATTGVLAEAGIPLQKDDASIAKLWITGNLIGDSQSNHASPDDAYIKLVQVACSFLLSC